MLVILLKCKQVFLPLSLPPKGKSKPNLDRLTTNKLHKIIKEHQEFQT